MLEVEAYTTIREVDISGANEWLAPAPSSLVQPQPAQIPKPTASHSFPWKIVGCSAIALLCGSLGWNLRSGYQGYQVDQLRSQVESQNSQIVGLSQEQELLQKRQQAFLNCIQKIDEGIAYGIE